jgi:hypothetical protein
VNNPYGFPDFADLVGKPYGEAIASQRLLDAINELRKDSSRGIMDMFLDLQARQQRIEAKLDAQAVRLMPNQWFMGPPVTPIIPAFPPEGPTCSNTMGKTTGEAKT